MVGLVSFGVSFNVSFGVSFNVLFGTDVCCSQQISKLFGRAYTSIGGGKIVTGRKMKLNNDECNERVYHLDLINTQPYCCQLFFDSPEDKERGKKLLAKYIEEKHYHSFFLDPKPGFQFLSPHEHTFSTRLRHVYSSLDRTFCQKTNQHKSQRPHGWIRSRVRTSGPI